MPHPTICALALTTLATAIVSAIYWFKSAAIPTPKFDEPIASMDDAPEQHIRNVAANVDILHAAMNESARLNKSVIHEVMHMVLNIPVTEEAKVVAISGVIQPRTRQ